MDRKTRKNLKSDKFAQEMQHSWEFLSEHQTEVKRYGPIALAVILIGLAVFFYMRHQADVREKALAEALRIDNGSVGPAPPGALSFPTQEEKDKAEAKAFGDLVAKYHGTQEGAIAQFYLASNAGEKGNMAEAEKRFKDLMDSAPEAYASLAKLSLARIYASEGKDGDAEKLARDLVAHPTLTVSKEEAQIELALIVGKKNPDEARKMLEPLRTERTAISRAAMQAMADVSGIH